MAINPTEILRNAALLSGSAYGPSTALLTGVTEGPDTPSDPNAIPAVIDPVTALEHRAELESIEGLHALRRQLLITLAPLKAFHGINGKFDRTAQSMSRVYLIKARNEYVAKNQAKPTEKVLEAEGYSHPEYMAWLDRMVAEHIEYEIQQDTYNALTERIRAREFALTAYSAEARLAR